MSVLRIPDLLIGIMFTVIKAHFAEARNEHTVTAANVNVTMDGVVNDVIVKLHKHRAQLRTVRISAPATVRVNVLAANVSPISMDRFAR